MKRLIFFAEPGSLVNGRVGLGLGAVMNRSNGWQVCIIRPNDDFNGLKDAIKRIAPAAIVSHWVFSNAAFEFLSKLGIPFVIACVDYAPDLDLPIVTTDNYVLGRIAAEHFLGQRLRHFARFGYWNTASAGERISAARSAGYRDGLIKSATAIDEFVIPLTTFYTPYFDPTLFPKNLVPWLKALPRPCGILTDDDALGASVIQVCQDNQIRVPEDISVLGAGNDIVSCRLSQPQLSSIAESFEEIGTKCADIILNWSKPNPPGRLICPVTPLGVIMRGSTEAQDIDDPIVSVALKYIAANIEKPYDVEQLLKVTRVSRQTLNLHFNKSLRCTPLMEIRRQRVERAKHLLATTNDHSKDIASKCGMNHQITFFRVFKELTGITPQEYRSRAQNLNF